MNIKVRIEYLDKENKEKFQEKASVLLSTLLIKKLCYKDIEELINILKDDSKNIMW